LTDEGKYVKEGFCDLKGEPETLEFTLRGGRSQADQQLTETVGKHHHRHHDLTRTSSHSQLLDEQLMSSTPSTCNRIMLFFAWLFSFLVLFGQWLHPASPKNKSQRTGSSSRHHHSSSSSAPFQKLD